MAKGEIGLKNESARTGKIASLEESATNRYIG